MSPIKEPGYFSDTDDFGRFAPAPIRSEAKYLRLFQGVKDEIAVGEASPSYLADPKAPQRIREVAPNARIIIILRDPVEQVYSRYLLHMRAGFQRLTFQEAVKLDPYLPSGFYTEPVQRYLDTFGADRIKILIFEEFIRDTREAVGEVLKFLGVAVKSPPSGGKAHNAFALPRGRLTRLFTENVLLRRTGRALVSDRLRRAAREKILFKKTAKPPMPEETRKFLEGLYRDDVLKLEKILGRSLPWFHARHPSE